VANAIESKAFREPQRFFASFFSKKMKRGTAPQLRKEAINHTKII